MAKKPKDMTPRFGIGEWFGFNLTQLSGEERRRLAAEVLKPKKDRTPQPCPFQPRKENAICSKCSLLEFLSQSEVEVGEL